MVQFPPYSLWLGSTGDLQDIRRLHSIGINAVVQLAYEEPPVTLPRDFVVCRFPILDGEGNDAELLRLAINSLTQLIAGKFATLACCQAGTSRTPGLVAASISQLEDEPLLKCLERVALIRPCQVHPALLAQLQSLSAA